jgi:N-acetylmuramoyl-L-alanine amidase
VVKAIKRITTVLLAIIFIFPFQPMTVPYVHAEEGKVSISTATVNVRTGPGLSYPVLTQVHRNQTFSIVESRKDWYRISTEKGEGWVANWLVSRETTESANETGQHGTVNTNGLRLRKGPSTSDPVVTVLNKGDKVSTSEVSGSWLAVQTGNANGWVHKDYINLGTQSSAATPSPKKEAKQGVITAGTLNVRKSATLNSPITGAVHRGNPVSITGSVTGWYEIQFGKAKAWISDNYVELTSTPVEVPSTSTEFTGMITVNSLNVRSEASLNGSIVGKVSKGEKFPILTERNNWIEIKLKSGKSGWIAGWFVQKTVSGEQKKSTSNTHAAGEKVTILHNGTNIRSSADVQSEVVKRAKSGETFSITGKKGDWYEIGLKDGSTAYVAGWIVSIRTSNGSDSSPSRNTNGGIRNKVITIDPGHGGRDSGTIGTRGTLEKLLTMKTAQLLADKLKSAGAEVIMTRKNDEYVSLPSRVSLSHYYDSDAFISIHFDSIYDSSVAGHTTYYYRSNQKDLAYDVHESLADRLPSRDRGVRTGDYHVIRENKQAAILLELGFLSNSAEEANLASHHFQDLAATAVYHGLNDYFSN